MKQVKTFIEAYGSDVEEFCISGIDQNKVTSSELIELLNLMPRLEFFGYNSYEIKVEETSKCKNSKRIKLSDELKLPKLQSIHAIPSSSVLEFFTNFLPPNSIVEFSCNKWCSNTTLNDLRKFFKTQKSIKRIETDREEVYKALDVLKVEEIVVQYNVDKIQLKNLPALKSIKFGTLCNMKTFKEICKLQNLESLHINGNNDSYELSDLDFKLLVNLKKLKKLKNLREGFKNFNLNQNIKWNSTSFEFMQELIIPWNKIDTTEVLECFPNLKSLRVQTSLKLNSFAKFMPKLERLRVFYRKTEDDDADYDDDSDFEYERRIEVFEVETGIVHENLKDLIIEMNEVADFWEYGEEFLELNEVFPNLELFMLKVEQTGLFDRTTDIIIPEDKMLALNFFEMFNKLKNLKNLFIRSIPLHFFVSTFEEIAEELKKLARKLQKVKVKFESEFDLHERRTFSYDTLIDASKDCFEIEADRWGAEEETVWIEMSSLEKY